MVSAGILKSSLEEPIVNIGIDYLNQRTKFRVDTTETHETFRFRRGQKRNANGTTKFLCVARNDLVSVCFAQNTHVSHETCVC